MKTKNTHNQQEIEHIDAINIYDVDEEVLRQLSILHRSFQEILYPEYFHENIHIDNIRKQILAGSDIFYSVIEPWKLTGFVVWEKNHYGWYDYDGIYVDREFRNIWVARSLVTTLIATVVKKYNAPWIICEIHEWNIASLWLHQDLWFILDSEIPTEGKFTLELDLEK